MLATLQLAACSAQPAASGQPRRVAITTFWDGSLSYECALPLWCQSAARLSAVLPEALAPEVVLIAPKPSPECPQARRRAMLNTCVPGPPHCTYELRIPASCVLYVPEAQGSLPPGRHARYVRCTRTSLGHTMRTAYRGTTVSTPHGPCVASDRVVVLYLSHSQLQHMLWRRDGR